MSSSKDSVYRLSFLFIIFLLFATTAESAEQWNLGLPNSFSAANVTTVLNLTYLSQNSVPFIGAGGQVTQDASNFSYFTANRTLVVKNIQATAFNDTDNTSYYIDPASSGNSAVFAGNVGIGTTSPSRLLHVYGASWANVRLESGTNTGVGIEFYTNLAGATRRNWDIITERIVEGAFSIRSSAAAGGAPDDAYIRLIILNSGNVGIGTGSFPSGGGTPIMVFGQAASNPTGMGASTAGIFAKSNGSTTGMYAIDSSSTTTKLTTGNDTLLAQSTLEMPYFTAIQNPYIGKDVEYDIGGAIAELENRTGKKFIYVRSIPKQQWAQNEIGRESEENNKSRNAAVEAWLRNASDVPVDKKDAFELVTETITETTENVTGFGTEFSYDVDGNVVSNLVPIYETKIKTKTKKVKKTDVIFNKKTGSFYRKPTKAEAEAAVGENYPHYTKQTPPKWMQDRGAN